MVVHLKSVKDKYLGTNGVYLRVDMEIYLQHGLQQKCAGLVSAGCSQCGDMSSNYVFNLDFYIIYYLFNIYFFRYCTDSGTHRVLRTQY